MKKREIIRRLEEIRNDAKRKEKHFLGAGGEEGRRSFKQGISWVLSDIEQLLSNINNTL